MNEIPESIKKKGGGIKKGQKKKKTARKKLLVKRDKKRRQNNEVLWKTGMLYWSLRETQGEDQQDFTREITSCDKNMTTDITFFFFFKVLWEWLLLCLDSKWKDCFFMNLVTRWCWSYSGKQTWATVSKRFFFSPFGVSVTENNDYIFLNV